MSELPLSGIPGSNPIGAMAAFGLFRILNAETPFGKVKLSWDFNTDWRPVLHWDQEIGIDQLIQFLIDRQPNRVSARFLTWNDDIKCDPTVFRQQLVEVISDSARQEDAAFFAAFGSDAITRKKNGFDIIKPTAFHMTAGQQKFLKSARELARSLSIAERSSKKQTLEQRHDELFNAWKETLIGPWTYRDSEHALGWDPQTEALYAVSDRSPSTAGPSSVRGSVWLAFECLPLFPTTPSTKKLRTAAFNEQDRAFSWPIWKPLITLETLRVILCSKELSQHKIDIGVLKARGIDCVFRAKCVRDGNGRGTFRNSIEVS